MNRSEEKLEQFEEAALVLVMDEYAKEDGNRILRDYEQACETGQQPVLPAELDEKLHATVNSQRKANQRKQKLHRLGRLAGKVAVFLLMLMPLLTATIVVVEANSQVYVERSLKQGCSLSDTEDQYIIHFRIFPNWQEHEPAKLSRIMESLTARGYRKVKEFGVNIKWMKGGMYNEYCNSEGKIVTLTTAKPISGKLIIEKDGCTAEELSYLGYDMVLIRGEDSMSLYWLDVEEGMYYVLFSDGLSEKRFWDLVYELARE